MPIFDIQVPTDHVGQKQDSVGAKRKHEDSAMDVSQLNQEHLTAKRQCKVINPDPEGDNGVVLSHNHLQQFNMPSQPLYFSPPIPTAQDGDSVVHGCMKDVIGNNTAGEITPMTVMPPTHHSSTPSFLVSLNVQREEGREESIGWMDMDGETYNPLMPNMDMEAPVTGATSHLSSFSPSHLPTQWSL